MTKLFFELNALDIRTRTLDEGRVPFSPRVRPHEITRGGLVLTDGDVRVTCALIDHPPMQHAFAYRFDTPGRSIVISGDTRRSDALIRLAQGADVLVHEAMYVPAVARLVGNMPNSEALRESII